jgi:hypothetical protein
MCGPDLDFSIACTNMPSFHTTTPEAMLLDRNEQPTRAGHSTLDNEPLSTNRAKHATTQLYRCSS